MQMCNIEKNLKQDTYFYKFNCTAINFSFIISSEQGIYLC